MPLLPEALCIFFQLPKLALPAEIPSPLDTWHNEQGDPGQVRKCLTHPLPNPGQGDMWPPHNVWYTMAAVLRSWAPKEGWEDMDGSPASREKAVQVLSEQLPEEEKVFAGHVSWLFLTALHHTMEKAPAEAA